MKLLIVGGVAGGASAAARARRLNENAQIIMFEKSGYISFANCGLPYHIGSVIEDRQALLVTSPQEMSEKFNIDVRIKSEVTAIDRAKKQLEVKELETGRCYSESYDYLILSPGAAPIVPPIDGIDLNGVYSLRNIEDMDKIINAIKGKNSAVVVGGGYIGLEMAEALREKNMSVSLVELASQVMGPADAEMATMLHSEIRQKGVDLRLNQAVSALKKSGDQLEVMLNNKQTLKSDVVIMAIGVRPENALAKDCGLEIGETGGVKVDASMQTSDKSIFAVGDAVEIEDFNTKKPALIPLAGPANRQGRIAADNIMGKKRSYLKTQGSAVCKVFDLTFAMTGLSEKQAKKNSIAYDKVYVHPASHASYYPGANFVSLKMLFNPEDGRVLGAQAVGLGGVDKRIDVMAVAIRAKMSVFDLEELELVYAPPYGSAKDPVNYAGFVAANILRNDAKHIFAEDIDKLDKDYQLLDVRTQEEVDAGKIDGAFAIALHTLRERLDELDKNKTYVVYCHAGLRGYLACRILSQKGFKALNLDGGYLTYQMVKQSAVYDKAFVSDDAGAGG